MRRILVAIDLTDRSRYPLGRALSVASASDARLLILCAVPDDASEVEAEDIRSRIRQSLEAMVDSQIERAPEVSLLLPRGRPADAILDAARQSRPDIIILGSHQQRFRDVIFGTTPSHVIHEAKAPVLVVRNDNAPAYRRVMLAVDHEMAEEVLEVAFRIASAEDIFVVHAFSPPDAFEDGDLLEDVRTRNDVLILRVKQQARAAAAGNAAVHFHSIVEEGAVLGVLRAAWSEIKPDLFVIGTHGRAGVARLLLGSHAEAALMSCPSDILIIRAPPAVDDLG